MKHRSAIGPVISVSAANTCPKTSRPSADSLSNDADPPSTGGLSTSPAFEASRYSGVTTVDTGGNDDSYRTSCPSSE